MAPGAINKLGATMFEPCVLRKQGTALNKVLATLLGLFGAHSVTWRPGIVPPCPPRYVPAIVAKQLLMQTRNQL